MIFDISLNTPIALEEVT